MTCDECRGKGKIEMLTRTVPCERCGGTGQVEDEKAVADDVAGFDPNDPDPVVRIDCGRGVDGLPYVQITRASGKKTVVFKDATAFTIL